MKLLLDTHVSLWASLWPDKLPAGAKTLLDDERHESMFSAVNMWEITTQRLLKRPHVDVDAHVLRRGLPDAGSVDLPVTSDPAIGTASKPLIHKDPFDRLPVCQATVEGIILVTSDAIAARYPGPLQRV